MIFFRKGRIDSGRLLSDIEREALGIFIVGMVVGFAITVVAASFL